MHKHLLAASLLCLGAAASAQSVLGKVAATEGVVTVSDGVTIGTAIAGAPIREGHRFVTAGASSARLSMDKGCDIVLKAHEAVTIHSDMSCAALLGAIQPVGGAPAVAVGGGSNMGYWVGGAVIAAALLGNGNGGGGGSNGNGDGGGGGNGGGNGGGGGVIPVIPPSGL